MWHTSIFALAGLILVHGNEPDFSEAVSSDSVYYPDQAYNETFESRADSPPSKYGVYVERVDLSACPYTKNYISDFYKRMVFNGVGLRERFRSYRMSLANQDLEGGIIGSTNGVELPNSITYFYHSWSTVPIMAPIADIRQTRPPILNLSLWYGMPQIYIPLYLASQSTGDAYMMHIYPEPAMLGYPASSEPKYGALWSMHNYWGRIFHIKIDIARMIEGLYEFKDPFYQGHYRSLGNIYTDGVDYAHAAFRSTNEISLLPGLYGFSTESICSGSLKTIPYSWAAFQSILKSQFTWL